MDARKLSVQCLLETERGGFSNLVFKRQTERPDMQGEDLSFAAALFYGTLERQITLDYILQKYVAKPLSKLDAEVRAILRSGLYQIHYMNAVPRYAAVNESVRLAKVFKKRSAGQMVNAVLRRSAAFDLRHLLDGLEGVETLSVAYALNEPLAAMLLAQYGPRAEEMMAGFFVRERQALRVNTLKATPAEAVELLKEEGVSAVSAEPFGALLVETGNALKTRAFGDGLVRLQSAAAQAAVAALDPQPGMLMLDLCAAPGGKTLTAAQQMKNDGEIVAFDKHENRLKLIEQRAGVEGITIVKTVAADSAEMMAEYREKADRVLADVPCSGYGEIASKPELRLKPPRVDEELEMLQYRILENGAACLKPGGRLVYSTCTVDRRENEGVCRRFMENHPDFCTVEATLIDGFELDGEGFYLMLPAYTRAEGFFVAVFERRK